jgi:hypothetical protein
MPWKISATGIAGTARFELCPRMTRINANFKGNEFSGSDLLCMIASIRVIRGQLSWFRLNKCFRNGIGEKFSSSR